VIFKKAWMEMMKTALCQQHYRLKHTYFDPFPLHMVMKTSPLKYMSNEQWNDLVDSWKNPKTHGIFLCKYQTLDLDMILCHMSYIYSIFDVRDKSKEQRQQRQHSVPSNYWLPELRGLHHLSTSVIHFGQYVSSISCH
jgi:hypothetical protein